MVKNMLQKKLDDKGFTLAELLVVMAIIVIMLAIAIPSILTLQRNLLLDEADKAAEAVANAAQLEMTSMKTDGTWASKVRNDDGSYKSEFPLAINPDTPAGGVSESHMRYMTAQTARDLGIITDLGIESSIRDSSYIIEFNGLTASVTRVYCTTGAVGFFGARVSSAHADNSVLDYYKSAPSEDRLSSRLSFEGCTIGRFVGTPDGATPSAALLNPSVSANEYGKIVLTNPNMRDAGSDSSAIKDLATEVTFTYPVSDAGNYSFTISGMTKNYTGDTYTVKATDGTNEYTCSFSNAPASNTAIYTVESNSRIELDLNDLASLLEDGKDDAAVGGVWGIVSAIQDASRKDLQSKMEAVCTVTAKDCLPVTGKAFLDWPSKVPTLKLFVTDPDPSNVDVESLGKDQTQAKIPDYISGSYASPDVSLVDQNGNPVDPSIISSYTGLISDSMIKASYSLLSEVWVNAENGSATKLPVNANWFNNLQNENVQEGSQTYSGKTIKIDTAKTIGANVLVSVGSYTSNADSSMTISNNNNGSITYDGKTRTNSFSGVRWPTDEKAEQSIGFTGEKHDYQIFEVWLDDGVSNHRVGYFLGEDWVWDDETLSDCVRDANTNGVITEDTTQLLVDSEALMSKAGELSKFQNYSLYVRTAPKSSEALEWFDSHSYTFAAYVSSVDGTTDQRGQSYGRPLRWLMENEFGASTTVAAWTVSASNVTSGLMKDKGGQSYPSSSNRARIYYSALPAVAWNTGGQLDSRYLELSNAQLMLYEWNKGAKSINRITFANGEDAMYSREVNDEAYQVRATAGADIAMLPSFDHLFYRVLTYFDSDGKTRFGTDKLSQQYTVVPLDGAGDARFPEAPAKSGMSFTGWKVTSESGTFTVERNEDGTMPYIADYVDQMKYGNVSLTAQYREGCDEKAGLVYIDDYDGGAYRYTGYLNANSAYVDDGFVDAGTLSDSIEPGYYISYYTGTSKSPKVDVSGSASSWNGKLTVSETSNAEANIDGSRYALYKVSFDPSSDSQVYTTVACKMSGQAFPSASFYCNSVFGGMVSRDEDEAATFGRSSYPWRVYNTDMFPGVFQSSMQDTDIAFLRKLLENNSSVSKSTNHYVQMRNLDFASVDGDSLNEWPVAFSGTYDGQGYAITNAENGFTRIPISGGSSISKIGTLNVSGGQEAQGLFPGMWGSGKDNPAQVSNLTITFGDRVCGDSMFGVVSGYAKQASFTGIDVIGSGDLATVELSGMGQHGTTDMFYASGAIVGRAEKCFSMQECSAADIGFLFVDSKLDISNNRFVFGGLAGVWDSTGKSAGEVPGSVTDLSVENIIFQLDSSLRSGKCTTISIGGLFGRFYLSGTASFDAMGWYVKDVRIINDSPYADSAVYPGVIAGSYGGSTKLYDGVCGSEGVEYEVGGSSYNLIKVYLAKQKIASDGLLSGTEWFFMNTKKASDLIAETNKLKSTPSTASELEDDDSDSSAEEEAKQQQDAQASSDAAAEGDASQAGQGSGESAGSDQDSSDSASSAPSQSAAASGDDADASGSSSSADGSSKADGA